MQPDGGADGRVRLCPAMASTVYSRPMKSLSPWRDRSGRFSALKAIVFGLLFLPGAVLAARAATVSLGPRPLTEIIHVVGLWGIRLLYLSLAVTPLRETLRWPRLLLVRRMIGVGAFCYLSVHLAFYTADQGFDLAHVALEIVRRIYLTIGFTALCIVGALAVTSTDGAVRRLGGRRWQRLHRLVYVAGILATIHYFMQSKQDVAEATVMAGLYAWLMLYRILRRLRTRDVPPPWQLVLLAVAATLLTFGGEAVYYWAKVGVDPLRVLAADFSLRTGLRPGWFVFAITAAVPLAASLRAVIWRAPARQAAS